MHVYSNHQGEGEEAVMVMFTQRMRDQDQNMQIDTEITEDNLLSQEVCAYIMHLWLILIITLLDHRRTHRTDNEEPGGFNESHR